MSKSRRLIRHCFGARDRRPSPNPFASLKRLLKGITKGTTLQNTRPTASNGQILAIVSIASFMISLDSQAVTLALNTIRVSLGASVEELEWTLNAYILTFAVLLLTGAALGDRYGRRRMFVVGLLIFLAASIACAAAPSMPWLIAARVAQGGGGALVIPLAMALLGTAFPREERAKALGIYSGITGLALIAGPSLGGLIAGGLSWRWIFWLNVPIGLVLIPFALRRIQEGFGSDKSVDVGGLVLVTGAALGTVWALMRGNVAGWTSLEVLGAFLGAGLLAVAFVIWQLRAREPMVPMRFFRSRGFSAGNASGFLLFAAIYGAFFFMALFLQSGLGHGPLAAGLRLLPWTATLFFVAPIAGAVAARMGERQLIAAGLLLQAVGLGWIALIATPQLAYVNLVPPFLVAGVGASMAMPATQAAVMNSVAPNEIGKASGVFSMLRFLGGVFGIALLVAVFAANGGFGSPTAFSRGFAAAIGVCALLSLLGSLTGIALSGTHDAALAPAQTPNQS